MNAAHETNQIEWRIPVGFQIIPSLVLSVGILFCPFSPRWLISRDREDEAQLVLMKIRSACYDDIKEELDRIRDEVAYLRENEIESYRQLFRPPLLRSFLSSIFIQIFQQLTGINGTISYAPQVFRRIFTNAHENLTDTSISRPLVLTGVYGSVYFLTALATIFIINRFRRKLLLVVGGLVMCIALVSVGILIRRYGKSSSINSVCVYDIDSEWLRVLLITLMHVYIVGFAFSWGPIPWAYCAEIFPLTVRAKATSLTTAANWLTSGIVTCAVPLLLIYLPYEMFLIFSFLCGFMSIMAFVFYSDIKVKDLDIPQTIEYPRQRNGSSISRCRTITQTEINTE